MFTTQHKDKRQKKNEPFNRHQESADASKGMRRLQTERPGKSFTLRSNEDWLEATIAYVLHSAEQTLEDTTLVERGVQGRMTREGNSDRNIEKPMVASLSQNDTFLLLKLKNCVGVPDYEKMLNSQLYSSCKGEAKQGSVLPWDVA